MNSSNSWRISNMSSCPKLRIEGFTDAWEQRKLGDVFKEYSEKNHLELPPLTIIQGKGTILREESDRNLQYDKANLAGYKLVRKNDLIVHLRSFEGGLERANTDGIVSPAYHMFHGDNTDTRFYYPFFRSKRFIDSLLKPHVYGIRDGKSIDIEGMKTIIIPVPSYEEQRRIGDFIESMDNLITLHQRKSDALKNAKKYFLKNMFPSEGEKFPKLRLEGFTDAWEQRKFVETFDFLPNNSLSRAQLTYENGTVKNVHYGDVLIKFGELLDVGNEELPYLIDDSLIKNYSSAVLKNGDVVIADAAEDETVGKCSEIKGIKDEKILSGLHTIPVRPRVEFESGYLGYFMNSHSYHDQLLPLIQGTKVSSISKKVLENTVISYPASSSGQEKIATFFESLTNLITLHQRKCDALKNAKKFFLQNMFV